MTRLDIIGVKCYPNGEDMCALKLHLERDEEVIFESVRAVITNKRLLANLDKRDKELVTDDVPLRNVINFKKAEGGRESRTSAGVKTLVAGLMLMFVQVLTPIAVPNVLEIALFLAGSLGVVLGLYFLLDSILRIKPYSSVVFSIIESRDVPVYFDGMGNPDADEMVRVYVRVKRDISIS